jgi:hypothetical protein
VRPLYDDGSSTSAQQVSRDYHLELQHGGTGAPVLTVYGGKITTYRRLAEHALERLGSTLDIPAIPGPRMNHCPAGICLARIGFLHRTLPRTMAAAAAVTGGSTGADVWHAHGAACRRRTPAVGTGPGLRCRTDRRPKSATWWRTNGRAAPKTSCCAHSAWACSFRVSPARSAGCGGAAARIEGAAHVVGDAAEHVVKLQPPFRIDANDTREPQQPDESVEQRFVEGSGEWHVGAAPMPASWPAIPFPAGPG